MTEELPRNGSRHQVRSQRPRAQALRESMSDTYEELEKTHRAYEQALSRAGNPLTSTDIIALRQAGREYAEAAAKHTGVVMAWLAMVDVSR